MEAISLTATSSSLVILSIIILVFIEELFLQFFIGIGNLVNKPAI